MASKAQMLRVAGKYGMVYDQVNSGKIGNSGTVILDHPSKGFGEDCRSITVCGYQSMNSLYAEAIERMHAECPDLEPCTDENCDYHHEEGAKQ